MDGGFQWSPGFVSRLQDTEGFTPQPKWDYKQYSWGYGTRWQPGMPTSVDKQTASNYLFDELGKARNAVVSRFGNLPQNVQEGLSSFTYNLGPKWMQGDNALTHAIQNGDWPGAARHMLAYDRAGGVPNAGLDSRRQWEGAYVANPMALGGPQPSPANQPPVPNMNVASNGAINSVGPAVNDVTGANKMPIQTTKTFGGAAPAMASVNPAQMQGLAEDDINAARSQAIADQLNKIALNSNRLPGSNLEGASRVFDALVGGYEGKQADKNTLAKRMAMADILGGSDPMVRLAAATGNDSVLNTVMSKQIENNMALPSVQQTGVDENGNPIRQVFHPQNGGTFTDIPQPAGQQKSDGPMLTGEDYLKTLPQDVATQVKNIADGKAPPINNPRTPQQMALMRHVQQYDPSADFTVWNQRYATRTDFSKGGPNSPAGILTNGRSALGHLASLSDSANGLGNTGDLGMFNHIYNEGKNLLKGQDNNPAMVDFNTKKRRFTEEATKFYRGTGGSQKDIQETLALFDSANTPQELQQAIRANQELIRTKLDELQTRWRTGMGANTDDFPIYDDATKAYIAKMDSNYDGVFNPQPKAADPVNPVRGAGAATSQMPTQAADGSIQMPDVTVSQGAPAAASGQKPPPDVALSQARAAIAAGKDPAAVKARLQGWGYDAGGL